MHPPLNRTELVTELRTRHPAKHELMLAFEDLRIRVECNAKDVRDTLRSYYAPFVTREARADLTITVHEAPAFELPVRFQPRLREAGKKLKEEFFDLPDGRIVRKRLTGMLFLFGGPDHLAIGPCRENPNQVVNFINNRHIEWNLRRGDLLGHAAGVLRGERGLALAGFSGAGKSTLALHLVSRGATFVSNDRLLLRREGQRTWMRGVAKLPRINPGTALHNPDLSALLSDEERRRCAQMPPDALWELEQKHDVPIEPCFGPDRFRLVAPLDGLVILNWRRSAAPLEARRVLPDERHDLLPALMKSAGLFYLPDPNDPPSERSVAEYAVLLEDCPLLELRGGTDFAAATEICMRLLERGELPPSMRADTAEPA
ncbi:MAG: HprK-related kinase B [Candidatus Eisenbacteria bacterium]|nr:HprK-related kinase B [Candidatus Eisenbacteria bacterium]